MKRNAVARIVLYTLLIFLLSGILVTALGVNLFTAHTGKYTESDTASIDASAVKELSIDWAAGSVSIVTGDTDQILFSEAGEFSTKYSMVYETEGSKLSIEYARETITVGIGSIPSKDLTVTVPKDWHCSELELDAAAVELTIDGLSVGNLELDCAAGEVRFNGAVDTIDCDGAAVELSITCTNKPGRIDVDGAACELTVTLPTGCGYTAQMNSVGCEFNSNAAFTGSSGSYKYGDESCKVFVDGLGSEVNIQIAD